MVLGTTRERPTVGERADDRADALALSWEKWQAERGPIHWEAGADLAGGFPGFEARGGRLEGSQFRLSDRYLLVDEGRPHGFGLPLSWLHGADLAPPARAERADPALRLRYADGAQVRTFQVRFRGSLLGPRGGRRAEQALGVLHALGLTAAGLALPSQPNLRLSWEAAAHFEGENVIWSGRATAPIGLSNERAACDVWLTTRSIIWGSSAGEGILRLPLEAALDVVPTDLADRARTPAVYVAGPDELGGRHDFPFLFDRHSPAQRNLRERGAFLVGLRSRGVPIGPLPSLPQPWQDVIVPAGLPATETAPSGHDPSEPHHRARRPAPTGRFRPRPAVVDAAEAPGRWEQAMAGWTGWDNWPPPPEVSEPAPPVATGHERLRAIAAEAAPDEPFGRPAAVRPNRGVIVPWPGTVRAGNANASDYAPPSAPTASPPAWSQTSTAREPLAASDGDTAAAEVWAAADHSAEIVPFEGSWPVPASFLGHAVEPHPLPIPDATAEPFAAADALAGIALVSGDAGMEAPTYAGDGVGDAGPPNDDGGAVSAAAPDTPGGSPESADEDAAPAGPRDALRRYEEGVLRVITGTLRAIEDRRPGSEIAPPTSSPSAAERTAALAALESLVAGGELPAGEAEVHRALLVAAGEAGPRLRSLLELRDAGYLDDAELERKARAIVAPLASLLVR